MIYVATPLYHVWMCTSKIVVTPVPITAIYVNATRYALFPGVRCGLDGDGDAAALAFT